jgi:hypothetical protein
MPNAVKAKISGSPPQGTLSFNDIIAHTPGRKGRGKAKKGMYQDTKNGNILVVCSNNPEVHKYENGTQTVRTGISRVGMFMISAKTGNARPVVCDNKPDGERKWVEFKGDITLTGNPHVVNRDQERELSGEEDADVDLD